MRRNLVAKAIVLVGVLLASGASEPANAQKSWDGEIGSWAGENHIAFVRIANAQKSWDSEAGAYLTYDFGGRRPGHFGFGVEVRAMYAQQQFDCGLKTAAYTGVAGRLSILGWDQLRVLIAPQVGLSGNLPGPSTALLVTSAIGGELGFGYRLKRDPGPFLQPGFEGSMANALFLRVDHAFGRDSDTQGLAHSGSVDLGLRRTPTSSHAPSGSSCD